MAVTFHNVNLEAGLQKLDEYLLTRSYITGYQASKDDIAVHAAFSSAPSSDYVNVSRWYNHIDALLKLSGVTCEGQGVTISGSAPPAEVAPSSPAIDDAKAPAAEDDDDDDVDLFGEETEEEKKAAEERAAAIKASGKKKESGKSSVLLDVKPWDDETDMQKLEEAVRSIQMDGLLWGASKLVPVGYGIKKLQIMMTIVDDLVSVDGLIEEHLTVEPANEYIQSCDIVAFNKIWVDMQKYSFSVKIQQLSSLFRTRLWDGAIAATVDLMEKKRRAAVVVLGDIGRSPRMQFHALSLARQADLEVDIVAIGGNEPYVAIKENQSIHLHEMKSVSFQALSKISSALALLVKAVLQFIILVWFLCFRIPRPDIFLVQNPPSVPTLAAVKFSSWLRRSSFVIDWHNFGYTLLGLSHGRSHIIVKIYHWFEKFFGRMADGSLCVTQAMQHELAQNWGIKATVLYDQPPEFFHPASTEEKHELFCRLENNICHQDNIRDCVSFGAEGLKGCTSVHVVDRLSQSMFTGQVGNDFFLKPNRPALVVSSTSWTPDEDFGMLLEAAVMYDRRVAAALCEDDSIEDEKLWMDICNGRQFLYPRLLFIITGKGPEKRKYEEQIKRLNLRRVAFRTMWLSAEDYPLLLGSADLGVCLHTSSSGLDLPMKVVDMFGCGLPVCAVSFSCIEELVKVEKNGLLFSSPSELADQFMMLFKGFPDHCDALKSLRDVALATCSTSRWSTEWQTHALPLIAQVISGERR